MFRNFPAAIALFFAPLFLSAQILPEHSVFHAYRGASQKWLVHQNHSAALYRIISNEAFRWLDVRAAEIERHTTAEDWLAYQEKVREKLTMPLTRFERSPLRAQITGTIDRENFTVEKLIFESQPGFYVTAALFLPKSVPYPAPAIVYTAGHTELGFRSETYQLVILNLVRKGFIVLAFDPLGQGERMQYYDAATGKSAIGGPTAEHTYAGIQTLMTGRSLSDYFIWDGIRAIDYLETRPEVDMKRVGITGRSGGGTQTAMIAAIDSRIAAAAPEAYITGFRRLFQSIGPQDAEQNPYRFLADTLDHADFLHARAPKPTLIITTEHDFFSQQGAIETFNEASRSFAALGYPNNLRYAKDEGGHTSTRSNREALYAFFQEFLQLPGNASEEVVELFPPPALWATHTGQVATDFPTAKMVFDLLQNQESASNRLENDWVENLRVISGVGFQNLLTGSVYTGKLNVNGITITKYFLENTQGDYVLPLYLMGDPLNARRWLIWLHPGGKVALLNHPGAKILTENGYVIVAPDLPGIGELSDPSFSGDGTVQGVPFNYTFGAHLTALSISGIRADALWLARQFIAAQFKVDDNEIYALAEGNLTTALVLYLALGKQMSMAVLSGHKDQKVMLQTRMYDPSDAFGVVPGTLPWPMGMGIGDLFGDRKVFSVEDVKQGIELLIGQ